MRDAERQKALERDEAATLYATLGRPPGVLARAWGSISVGCIWLFLWPVAFVADALVVMKVLEVVSRAVHATLFEILPNKVIWTGIGVILYATLAIPLAVGVYGNRRTSGRRRLQASLAALPSDRAGGPVRCRSCEAPLDVRGGELGLACVYCGADNLVRMPGEWVAGLRRKVGELDARIETIGREDREMKTKERRSLRRHLAWPLVFIPLMALIGFASDRDTDAFPPNYSTAMVDPRVLIPAVPPSAPYDTYRPDPFTANGSVYSIAFNRSENKGEYSLRSYLVPLRSGETVTFTSGVEGVDVLAEAGLEAAPFLGRGIVAESAETAECARCGAVDEDQNGFVGRQVGGGDGSWHRRGRAVCRRRPRPSGTGPARA